MPSYPATDNPRSHTFAWRLNADENERMVRFTKRFETKSDALRWLFDQPTVAALIDEVIKYGAYK